MSIASAGPGRRQPHRLPPPITHAPEALEGMAVLTESPGELGCLLWKSVRAVEMWSALKPPSRKEAFLAEAYDRRLERIRSAEVPVTLFEPLVLMAGVLRGDADGELLAGACRRVAEWAERDDRLGTALAFMQAGALAAPQDAELACRTAQLAQAAGQFGRAETWYRQAVAAGRRFGAWRSYELGHLGLAKLLVSRGNQAGARRSAQRALRSATRRAHRELQGRARHELAELALRAGKRRDSLEHARRALQAYGPGHERLPVLALRLAYLWTSQAGYHDLALEVLEALRGHLDDPVDALHASAHRARAAAGAGERRKFEEAWAETMRALEGPVAPRGAARALLELARGAALLGDPERAEQAARRALAHAPAHGDGELLRELQTLGPGGAGLDGGAPRASAPRALVVFAGELTRSLPPSS